jgi:NADPH:quinone reductase-like Zn-dependent oxidoreductase
MCQFQHIIQKQIKRDNFVQRANQLTFTSDIPRPRPVDFALNSITGNKFHPFLAFVNKDGPLVEAVYARVELMHDIVDILIRQLAFNGCIKEEIISFGILGQECVDRQMARSGFGAG